MSWLMIGGMVCDGVGGGRGGDGRRDQCLQRFTGVLIGVVVQWCGNWWVFVGMWQCCAFDRRNLGGQRALFYGVHIIS
jgi:hypothetical protein